MDPASVALLAITAGLGAAGSAAQASSQNRAARRSAAAAREGAKVQSKQLAEAADLERRKYQRERDRIIGRLRVTAADAGGFAGAFDDLVAQAEIDTAINEAIIDRNFTHQKRRVASGLNADLATISAHTQNALLATLSGSLSGLASGLQIGVGIKDFRAGASA